MPVLIRPLHGPTASGPWTPLSERAPGLVTFDQLTNDEIRYLTALAHDTDTGLVSELGNIRSGIPSADGGGSTSNPSDLVNWPEPTAANTGPQAGVTLDPYPDYNVTSATLIRNARVNGGIRIAGPPRHVVIEDVAIDPAAGLGGANINTNFYGIDVHSDFTGGHITINRVRFEGASSASIYARRASFDIRSCHFKDSGADHIKANAETRPNSFVTRCFFERMANSYWNANYNSPFESDGTTANPDYQVLSKIHGDAMQLEDLPLGANFAIIGNSFDLIGTYSATNAPQPTVSGFPIAAYSAAIFVVARNGAIGPAGGLPPVHVEGNWIKGCTIPVRFDNKNGNANDGWWLRKNIWRPEIEFALLDRVGTGDVSGNLWGPTGQNIDAFILSGSGPDPTA